MDRAHRVSRLWDWLPAFRAVAETEHLPSAAEAMHVSPSALSRSIRLLEDDIGQPLFDRPGRSIALNPMGARFLVAVRDAMRGIHSALELVEQARYAGPVRVSVPLHWARSVFLPVVSKLNAEHPELVPELVAIPQAQVVSALQQGNIDVAVVDISLSPGKLACEQLGEFSLGVFAAPSHPLTVKKTVEWSEVRQTRFVELDRDGWNVWPAHRPRRVAATVSEVRLAADACRHAGFAAVLPDEVADAHGLRRIRLPLKAGGRLFLLHRPTLSIPGRTEAVASLIRDHAKGT